MFLLLPHIVFVLLHNINFNEGKKSNAILTASEKKNKKVISEGLAHAPEYARPVELVGGAPPHHRGPTAIIVRRAIVLNTIHLIHYKSGYFRHLK